MEAASHVKAVVVAINQYQNNPSESNELQLQRQLDVLTSLAGRGQLSDFFNPKDLLPTECLSGLIDILNHVHIKPTLAQTTMLLLENLASSAAVRDALHATFHMPACLANFLKTLDISAVDPNAVLCIKLLQKITYNIKISFEETFVEDLARTLMAQIQGKKSDLTEPSLGLMANLCRRNPSVQMVVKNQEKIKAFYQKLGGLLADKNNRIVVFTLSIIASLCLNEELGEKIFHTRNINQIFQLLLSIIRNNDSGTTRRHTVRLFSDLTRHTRIQNALAVYDHLEACIKQVLSLLTTKSQETSKQVFELLLALCSVADIRRSVARAVLLPAASAVGATGGRARLPSVQGNDPFLVVVHWAGQPVDGLETIQHLALDFLREIYEEVLDQGLTETVSANTDLILTAVFGLLAAPVQLEGHWVTERCNHVVQALRFANVLCSDDAARRQLSHGVSMEMCREIIQDQLNRNPISVRSQNQPVSQAGDDWSDAGLDIVLLTLDLMVGLGKEVANMEKRLCSLLQDERLVPFLASGLTSGERQRVQIVFKLIRKGSALPDFPSAAIGDAIAAHNSRLQSRLLGERRSEDGDVRTAPPSGTPYNRPLTTSASVTDKENVSWSATSVLGNSHTAAKGSALSNIETSVDGLIEKMQSGFELKDARASELISVYEHKLQSLQTKEHHLQDLLEAKAVALSQADRLITQYRCRIARADAEARQLRALLQEWEKRTEEYREQLNEMMIDRERLQNDLEQVTQDNARLENIAEEHKELTENFTEQTQRLENAQRQLATLKQEHTSLSDMHEMLRRHNESLKQQHDVASQQLLELEEERKTQAKLLKEREARNQELTRALEVAEGELGKAQGDQEDLEAAIDKLRATLAKTEQLKKDLQRQVSTLELLCQKHEAAIKEKDSVMKEQKDKIDKHNEIAQLIHSLSSGQNPQPGNAAR